MGGSFCRTQQNGMATETVLYEPTVVHWFKASVNGRVNLLHFWDVQYVYSVYKLLYFIKRMCR